MNPTTERRVAWLCAMPFTVFAIGMGLIGLGLCWRFAGAGSTLSIGLSEIISTAVGISFGLAGACQLVRTALFPSAVVEELLHPVRGPLFGQFAICLLLLAEVVLPKHELAAIILVSTGAVIAGILTLFILCRSIIVDTQPSDLSPSWLVPIIGIILAAALLAELEHRDASMISLGAGLIALLLVAPILIVRLIHSAMPLPQRPLMAIFMAPVALVLLAADTLNGSSDLILILSGIMFVPCLIVAAIAPFWIKAPFSLAWWAFGMPPTAVALAAIVAAKHLVPAYSTAVAGIVTVCVSVMTGLLVFFSPRAIAQGRLYPRG